MADTKPLAANKFKESSLLNVLLALQSKTNRELHVASLCLITSIANEKEKSVRCALFPRQEHKEASTIVARFIRESDFNIAKNALNESASLFAVVLFVDLDYTANYDSMTSTKRYSSIEVKGTLHGYDNGVVIYLGDALDGRAYEEFIVEER